jgi:hypothetical protein
LDDLIIRRELGKLRYLMLQESIKHYGTNLILASLWIVDDLILGRELERLLDVLKQVAPRH